MASDLTYAAKRTEITVDNQVFAILATPMLSHPSDLTAIAAWSCYDRWMKRSAVFSNAGSCAFKVTSAGASLV